MGNTYTRQSSFTDGDVITADLFNNEYDQLLAAFAASTGHTHDGTAAEGGPITKLLGTSITIGDATSGTDITVTFDGESNDGVFKWMEDEDYFEYSDDILIASTEKLQFRDTAIYINSSADGQLDLVADTEIQIAATTIDINGAADISGNLAVGGNLTVTGTTTFNGGTLTLGDSSADNVVFGADVDSSIIPDDDDTYDLGSASQQWRNIFIDGTAEIDTLAINGTTVTSTAAELNILDGVTSTAAELNILDGVTSTAAEINIVDGDTSATATTVADADRVILNDNGTMVQVAVTDLAAYFDDEITAMPNLVTTAATTVGALDSGSITSGFGTIDTGSSTITTTGLISGGSLDIDDVVINGSTIGHTDDTDLITVASGIATVAGELSVTTLDIGGTNVTSTATELNLLDGVSGLVQADFTKLAAVDSTAAELNIVDGGTSATSTTVVDADRVVMNDNGTMVQVAVTDLAAYFDDEITAMPNLVTTAATTVGALNSGSITSGFGTIDTGSSNITTTGVGSFGSLDISGDIDVDGTTNLDVVDIDGAVDMASTLQVDGAITSSAGATITTADNTAQLTLRSTDTDANVGPVLDLNRNVTGADDDNLGSITFTAKDDSGNAQTFAKIDTSIRDASNSTEASRLNFHIANNGSETKFLGFIGQTASAGAEITFNEDSNDIDFRVESNGNANMLFVDGGNDGVAIGTATVDSGPLTVQTGNTHSTAATFQSTGTTQLFLKDTDAATDNKYWGFQVSGGSLNIITCDDDKAGGFVTPLELDQTDVKLGTGADLITNSAGTSNLRLGVNAGNSITSGGNYNTVVGDEAGTALTTGDNNVAIGFEALKTEDAHGENVAVGYQALKTQNAGASGLNVAVGYKTGTAVTTGIRNTLIGGLTGDVLTDADFNTALGYAALSSDTLGSKSVALGYSALEAQNFTTATDSFNVAVGYEAGHAVTTGIKNTLIGSQTGDALTNGDNNVALGHSALGADTLGEKSVAVGTFALLAQNFTTLTDTFNTAVGHAAGTAVTTGTENTLIGGLSGDAITTGIRNVAVGSYALSTNVAGDQSVAVGHGALFTQNPSGNADMNNTAVGHDAGNQVTTGVENTLIGALAGDALTTGNYNTAVGKSSGGALTTGIENVFVGVIAGDALTDADYNVAMGSNSLTTDTLGSRSVAIGAYTLSAQNFTTATNSYNVAVGYNAGNDITTGVQNTIIGGLAGDAITTGTNNVAFGYNALGASQTGTHNTAVGNSALGNQNVSGTNLNTAVGAGAGSQVTSGVENTFLGAAAGDALTDADYNVAIGKDALGSDTLGSKSIAIGVGSLLNQNLTTATDAHNVCVGHATGNQITTGVRNVMIGGLAGDGATTIDDCVIIGYEAGGGATMTGHDNVFVGKDAGIAVTSGQANVFVGKDAGESNITGQQNVIVGALANTAVSDGNGANVLGYSVSGTAGYTTLGNTNDDIRAAHGNVTWATVSDERYKKDIVDSTAGLSFINALKPRTFKYKNLGELPETFKAYKADSTDVFKNSTTNHGFIAQEVKAAIDADSSIKDGFRLWDDREDGSQEVAEAALIPILVKAIQEQNALIEALTARVATLEG